MFSVLIDHTTGKSFSHRNNLTAVVSTLETQKAASLVWCQLGFYQTHREVFQAIAVFLLLVRAPHRMPSPSLDVVVVVFYLSPWGNWIAADTYADTWC